MLTDRRNVTTTDALITADQRTRETLNLKHFVTQHGSVKRLRVGLLVVLLTAKRHHLLCILYCIWQEKL